jgi:hypothetical protein
MNIGITPHPFYEPLWRRIAIVALTALWLGIELWIADGMWTVIAAAFFGYAVWGFLISYGKR